MCRNEKIKQIDAARNLWDVTYSCGAVEQVDMRASNHAIPENDRTHNRRVHGG